MKACKIKSERVAMDDLSRKLLDFLHSRGYTKAEEALRQDLSAHPLEDYAASSALDSQATVIRQILSFNQQENNPEWYADSYRDLRRWVEASLDIYRVLLVTQRKLSFFF
jgi:hypothetical protein